jgi:hypothetical protein
MSGHNHSVFVDNNDFNQILEMGKNGDLNQEEAIEKYKQLNCVFLGFEKGKLEEIGFNKKMSGLDIQLTKNLHGEIES